MCSNGAALRARVTNEHQSLPDWTQTSKASQNQMGPSDDQPNVVVNGEMYLKGVV